MTDRIDSRRITMKDVAKRTGLSISTVSHVVNESRFVTEKTRKRVLSAIRELGYSPNIVARSLKGKGTRTIGVIIPDVRQVFFAETIRAIESRATEKGFNVILCDAEDDVEEEKIYAEAVLSKGVDGLIVAPVDAKRSLDFVRGLDVPCVQIDRRVLDYEADFVGINNAEIAELATSRLIEGGRKHVAFIGYSSSVYTMRERLEGYRAAIARYGLCEHSHLIADYADGDFRTEVSRYLQGNHKIDAILSGNDDVCFAIAWHLRSPGNHRDIEIVTFDQNRWHEVVPLSIRTIRQPTSEIGKAAIDLLVARCSDRAPQKTKDIICRAELLNEEVWPGGGGV